MLRAAGRLIRADLSQRPVQAALTGLVIAIAAAALLVTLYLRAVLDEPFGDLMRETNGAHVTVFGPREEVAAAAGAPEVVAASGPTRLVPVAPERGPRVVLGGLEADAVVDRPLLVSGRAPRERGEVMLGRGLSLGSGLGLGDELTLRGGESLTVVGTAVVAMPAVDGWVTPAQAATLDPVRVPDDERGAQPQAAVALRLRDPGASPAVAARFVARPGVRARDWLGARDEFTEDSRRNLAILSASTLLALLAAGFTLATAIGGRVLSERRRIGLLRAVGVTPRGVTAVLVGHYLALALLAAPAGLLAGWLLAPPLLGDTLALLGTPRPGPPGAALIAQVLALVLAAVAVACALPAWRAGRLPPVVALAPVRPAAGGRASRAARVVSALRLPVVAALGAKDAYVRRVRAVLTMASVTLAAVAVVCALAFEATVDRFLADPALSAQPWDLSVESDSGPPGRIDRMLTGLPGVAEVGRRYWVPVSAGAVELETRAIDGSPDAFAFSVPDGRGARRAGEATLGRGALERLGVEIGDRVTLSASGRPFTVRVVGRHVEPANEGLGIVTPAGSVPAAALGRPGWIVRLGQGGDPGAVRTEIERRARGDIYVQRTDEAFEAGAVRPIVLGVAALLVAIAFVNLLTTLALGVRERRRDVAVLGAVGATRRQITATVVAGGVLLALPALLAGLPLGAWLFRTVVSITDPSDGPDVATLPEWWVLVATLPVALVAVAAVASLASREAARIGVAAALRAE
jgi:putative ABC transport system permease protein